MAIVEEKVGKLEEVLSAFIKSVDMEFGRVAVEFTKLYDSQRQTEAEMRAFKDEMRAFKDEMGVFKDEMRAFKDEMRAFKDEMRVFKDEMRASKDEMNKKWGEMANKMGTITEDLTAPSIPRIIQEEFGIEVSDLMIRRKKKLSDGRRKEYDCLAVAGDYVFVNSTKSSLDTRYVNEFIKDIQGFKGFFPEYKENKLIGILATLYVDESLIKYIEKKGLIILAIGDELMDVKNRKGFKPKEW